MLGPEILNDKKLIYNGPLFEKYLLNSAFLKENQGPYLLNEHGLLGWMASIDGFPLVEGAKKRFKAQWFLNHTYLELLKKLAPKFEYLGIRPILLKGISFLDDYYPKLGSRSMSDMDILVDKSEESEVINLFVSQGFEVIHSKKWKANNYKTVLNRTEKGVELVIEIHTKLLHHIKAEDQKWEAVDFSIAPYRKLEINHLIVYQATHLAFQHTFIKIFWLLDIHLIFSREKGLMDEDRIIQLAKNFKVYQSLLMVLHSLEVSFETKLGPRLQVSIKRDLPKYKKKLLNLSFLLYPTRHYLKYLLIKHFSKDSLKEALLYDLGWLLSKN